MSNNIKDILKDILNRTHSLGIFEMVKITGSATETVIETLNGDKTVIVKGVTAMPVPEFVDSTVGLSRMSVLHGYLQYPGFNVDGSSVSVTTETRNGVDSPSEVKFVADDSTTAHYRFMAAEIINQQLKDIKFKGATFDLTLTPTQKNLKDLSYFNGVLGSFESTFSPRTENGQLYFYIGDNGGDRTKILIADNAKGTLSHQFYWPLDIVLKILKLGDECPIEMSFNAKGLLQIQVNSGLGQYTYLLPAKG